MKQTDYIFGMNYIDQLQEGRALRCSSVERLLSYNPNRPIDSAFNWSLTRQRHSVWLKRERIFDLFFGVPIMNEFEVPASDIHIEEEPLLIGLDRPLPY